MTRRQRLASAYHLGVLWLLAACARRVVETIYQHGHEDGYEDGATERREFMRREILEVQVAMAADRARAYQRGFADAMRLCGDDEPVAEPVERVM
jgi:hypothetical protein